LWIPVDPRDGEGAQPCVAYDPTERSAAAATVRVLFVLADAGRVVLQDTPAAPALDMPIRAVTRGCIGVDRALDVARLLASEVDGVAAAAFDRLSARPQEVLELRHPVPITIDYNTVGVQPSGRVLFYADVYGLDPG